MSYPYSSSLFQGIHQDSLRVDQNAATCNQVMKLHLVKSFALHWNEKYPVHAKAKHLHKQVP